MTQDWVAARNDCSAFAVFVQLRTDAKSDVDTRNGLRNDSDQVIFKFQPGDETFTVLREGPKISASVEFRLEKGEISARRGSGEIILQAIVTLNDDLECRLQLASEPKPMLTGWQFRKRALEDLFFAF